MCANFHSCHSPRDPDWTYPSWTYHLLTKSVRIISLHLTFKPAHSILHCTQRTESAAIISCTVSYSSFRHSDKLKCNENNLWATFLTLAMSGSRVHKTHLSCSGDRSLVLHLLSIQLLQSFYLSRWDVRPGAIISVVIKLPLLFSCKSVAITSVSGYLWLLAPSLGLTRFPGLWCGIIATVPHYPDCGFLLKLWPFILQGLPMQPLYHTAQQKPNLKCWISLKKVPAF